MKTRETELSGLMKAVFWFVVINSVGGALSLILFPTQTETYFFWNIMPPINAMLMGTLYLVAGMAVAYAALRGTWEVSRVIAVMGFTLSVILFVVTLIHVDRFVPGFKLYYWLFVYLIFPVLVAVMYWRYERAGANWQVIDQEIKPIVRLAALGTGLGMLAVAVVGLLFPDLIVTIWPWTISPLMVRVFLSWLSALSVSNLWFWIEKEWTHVQLVAYMLIATPVVVTLVMVINRVDLRDNSVSLTIFSLLLGLIGLTGIFMLWQQRR